jgi:hypothetical protein
MAPLHYSSRARAIQVMIIDPAKMTSGTETIDIRLNSNSQKKYDPDPQA